MSTNRQHGRQRFLYSIYDKEHYSQNHDTWNMDTPCKEHESWVMITPTAPLGLRDTVFLFFHFSHWKWRQTRARAFLNRPLKWNCTVPSRTCARVWSTSVFSLTSQAGNFCQLIKLEALLSTELRKDSSRGHDQEWIVFPESYDGTIEFASTWPVSGINWGKMSTPPLSTRIMNEGPFLVSMEHENLCVITIPTVSIPNYAWWLIREHSLECRRKKSFYSVLMVIECMLWVFNMSYFNW